MISELTKPVLRELGPSGSDGNETVPLAARFTTSNATAHNPARNSQPPQTLPLPPAPNARPVLIRRGILLLNRGLVHSAKGTQPSRESILIDSRAVGIAYRARIRRRRSIGDQFRGGEPSNQPESRCSRPKIKTGLRVVGCWLQNVSTSTISQDFQMFSERRIKRNRARAEGSELLFCAGRR